MIVEARLEVLPADVLPTYHFDRSTDVRGYCFKRREWSVPRVVVDESSFISGAEPSFQNRLMDEAQYGSPEEMAAMVLEAMGKSPHFTFFVFVCFERKTVGLWTSNGQLFDHPPEMRGSPEEVAWGVYPLAVARSVIQG